MPVKDQRAHAKPTACATSFRVRTQRPLIASRTVDMASARSSAISVISAIEEITSPARSRPASARSMTSSIPCIALDADSPSAFAIAPISRLASADRSASLRTSLATTANPFPASRACAASIVALTERRLVWRAITASSQLWVRSTQTTHEDHERLPPPPRANSARRSMACEASLVLFEPFSISDPAS